jgi:hypothetical protein
MHFGTGVGGDMMSDCGCIVGGRKRLMNWV